MTDTLLREAADPATDPDRLAELVNSPMTGVARLAKSNPALPAPLHRSLLEAGSIWAWMNPQTPFTLLIEGTSDEIRQSARQAAIWVWSPTHAFDPIVLRNALAPVLEPWWASATGEVNHLFSTLHRWALRHYPHHETPSFTLGLAWLESEAPPDLVAGQLVREALQHLRTWQAQPEATSFRQSAFTKATAAAKLMNEARTGTYGTSDHRLLREVHVAEAAVSLARLAGAGESSSDTALNFVSSIVGARARTHAVAALEAHERASGGAWDQEQEQDPVSWEDIQRFWETAVTQLADEVRLVQPSFPWSSIPPERWATDGMDDEEMPF